VQRRCQRGSSTAGFGLLSAVDDAGSRNLAFVRFVFATGGPSYVDHGRRDGNNTCRPWLIV